MEDEGVKLEDAAVIYRRPGIGGPEGFKQLEELAKLLNGAVGRVDRHVTTGG